LRQFLFRLALALGRTVRELEEGMDSRELSEWLAYCQIDPLPDSHWQTGLLASTMTNLWSKSRTSPEDFIPRPRTRRRRSGAELLARFRGIADAANARAAAGK
jgi:hypothetical protein